MSTESLRCGWSRALASLLLVASLALVTASPSLAQSGDDSGATMPDPTADPDEVRREAERILRDGDFGRSDEAPPEVSQEGDPGTPGDASEPREAPVPPAFGGMGAVGQVVMWILVVAVAALAMWLIWRFVRNRRGREGSNAEDDDFLVEDRPPDATDRPSDEWLAMAEQAEAAGAWRDGLLYRYRSLVVALIDAAVVEPVVGRTVGEHREDVALRAPGGSESFDEAAWLFERAWYGERSTGPEERDRFRILAEQARSALDRMPVGAS